MYMILAGINLFVLGYGFCFYQNREKLLPKIVQLPAAPTPVEMTDKEKEFLEEEKRKLADANTAFQTLMGYNSAMAYGVTGKRGGR